MDPTIWIGIAFGAIMLGIVAIVAPAIAIWIVVFLFVGSGLVRWRWCARKTPSKFVTEDSLEWLQYRRNL